MKERTELSSKLSSSDFLRDSRNHAAALFWGGILLGLIPFLVKYCRAMWFQDLYQYFPFLLAGVFGLAYTRFDQRLRLPGEAPDSGWFSIVATFLCLIAMVAAGVLASSWLGAVAFVFATAGFLSAQRESCGVSLGYLALPMIMFIRAPLLGTYTIMNRLQLATTRSGSILLDVLGVIHFKLGNTIELVNKSLFVAEACSGVQSLFTMCFLTLILWAYKRRPYALVPFYLAFAFLFAVVGNVIRVTTIALAEAWFSIDLASGLPHELVGYASLTIAAGMMASLDHVLGLLPWLGNTSVISAEQSVGRQGVRDKADADKSRLEKFDFKKSLERLSIPQRASISVSVCCGLAMVCWTLLREPDKRPIVARDQVLFEPRANFLVGLDAPIQVWNYEHRRDAHAKRNARHGMNSDGWNCQVDSQAGPSVQGQFVLSQPYMGWHELTVCYRSLEWQMIRRTPIVPLPGAEPIVVADFKRNTGEYGTLFFTAVDSDGSIPRVPGHTSISRSLAPLEPLIFDDFAELTGSAQTIMLQYWSTGEAPLSEAQKQQVVTTMNQLRTYTSYQVAQYTQRLLED